MSNISFTGNVTTKMQKLVEKAIKKGDLNGQQVQKFYKHILNNSTDTFSYSLEKVDIPNSVINVYNCLYYIY